ncbi:MAG: SRPBCC domain-containing protein [Saprospiraceae bacterium]|nr:SRPBCC domain-containing protein [Saprospiraceae bacterium]
MADLYHNLKIEASASRVFDAFSRPEHLNNWWTLESSGQPEVGEIYRLYFGDPYDWRFRVSRSERNNIFEWKVQSADKDWEPTSVGIELKEVNDGVTVNFYHINWPEDNDHYKHSNYCWAHLLNGLKKYVEEGTIIPFDERA